MIRRQIGQNKLKNGTTDMGFNVISPTMFPVGPLIVKRGGGGGGGDPNVAFQLQTNER